jgi:hypothetical protein
MGISAKDLRKSLSPDVAALSAKALAELDAPQQRGKAWTPRGMRPKLTATSAGWRRRRWRIVSCETPARAASSVTVRSWPSSRQVRSSPR